MLIVRSQEISHFYRFSSFEALSQSQYIEIHLPSCPSDDSGTIEILALDLKTCFCRSRYYNAREILTNSRSKITARLYFRKDRSDEPPQVAPRPSNQQNHEKHAKNDFYRQSKLQTTLVFPHFNLSLSTRSYLRFHCLWQIIVASWRGRRPPLPSVTFCRVLLAFLHSFLGRSFLLRRSTSSVF